MDDSRDIKPTSPDGAPQGAAAFESAKLAAVKANLPRVESPSVSPAGPLAEPVDAPVAQAEPVTRGASASEPAALAARFAIFNPRQKRHALLAASVAIAAAFGAVVGAVAGGGFATPAPQVTVAATEDRKAMEQSIARLAKEVTTLKTNLEAANKAAHTQIAKISERADRIERNASAELLTGAISAPQTVTPAPLPTPRPAPRIATPDVAPPARMQVVQEWTIRDTRDGYVYVQGHGGDVYQVVPGAPLPGLGPVESIRRLDGRWVVTTPKGIIVSMRDRRYFE